MFFGGAYAHMHTCAVCGGYNSALGGHRALPKVANERYCYIFFIFGVGIAGTSNWHRRRQKFFFAKYFFWQTFFQQFLVSPCSVTPNTLPFSLSSALSSLLPCFITLSIFISHFCPLCDMVTDNERNTWDFREIMNR